MSYLLGASAVVVAVSGHGGITKPEPREATVDLWFNEGCQIGCNECKGHVNTVVAAVNPYIYCLNHHGAKQTISDDLRTYPNSEIKHNPWLAPGSAPVFSPCGLAAGQAGGSYPANGDVPPAGYKPGDDARDIQDGPVTEWPVGSIQEVSWRISANHGGGYAVRLCPASENLTEECFQSHHLPFVGDSSWIEFGNSPANRTEIRANRTTTGTTPSNSQWTKVPIPSCGGAAGGGLGCDTGCEKPQFDSPVPGLWGNGPGNGCAGCDLACGNNRTCNAKICGKVMGFAIIDQVEVPQLPEGDYVMSFRWDCEQTAQIWSQCANIKITNPAVGSTFQV